MSTEILDLNGLKRYDTKIKEYINQNDLFIVPSGTTQIASEAYYNTNYKYIIIPDWVTSIGKRAFAECKKLIGVSIPNTITSAADSVFFMCTALTSVTLPYSLINTSQWLFSYCTNLKNIIIPEGVKIIGDGLAYRCSALTEIIIPNTVTSIGGNAFTECGKMKKLDLTSYGLSKTFPSLGTNALLSTSSQLQILVPKGRKTELARMTNWTEYADQMVEIGVIEAKLDRLTSGHNDTRLYGQKANGTDATWQLQSGAYPDTVMFRGGNGRSQIADPVSDNDIANKHYVDNAIANSGGGSGGTINSIATSEIDTLFT